jgi:glycine dehydrogenase subunit 1
MLAEIGAGGVEDLFAPIPDRVKVRKLLDLPPAMSEMEMVREYQRLAGANTSGGLVCFRGQAPTTTSYPRRWTAF